MMDHLKRLIKKELGQLLVEEKIINEEQLKKALDIQKENGELLGQCLIKLGYLTEEEIINCIMIQYGFPYLPLENYTIGKDVLKLIPKEVARKNFVIPVDKIGNTLTIAMANPLNVDLIKELEKATSLNIEIFITTSNEILKALDFHYKTKEEK